MTKRLKGYTRQKRLETTHLHSWALLSVYCEQEFTRHMRDGKVKPHESHPEALYAHRKLVYQLLHKDYNQSKTTGIR